jgi:periplasmic copper chaperone A
MLKLRLIHVVEISVAILLTLAALLFAFAVYAAPGDGLEVEGAWARPTIGQSRPSAAYMTLTNKGPEDVVLEGAVAPGIAIVEIHETSVDAEGVAQMRQLETLVVPAGEAVVLEPGGMHLMLIGAAEALKAGDKIALSFAFASGQTLDVDVAILDKAPEGASDSHHDHDHHHHR